MYVPTALFDAENVPSSAIVALSEITYTTPLLEGVTDIVISALFSPDSQIAVLLGVSVTTGSGFTVIFCTATFDAQFASLVNW